VISTPQDTPLRKNDNGQYLLRILTNDTMVIP
jgi:hypothetical protein